MTGHPPNGAPGPESNATYRQSIQIHPQRSMEGSGKGVVGVSSHRCVVEDGGMVVLMHSALSLTQARLGKCRGNGGRSTADHAHL